MWYIIFPYAVLPSLPYIIHRFNEFGEPISYDTPLRSLYHTICYTVTCLPGGAVLLLGVVLIVVLLFGLVSVVGAVGVGCGQYAPQAGQ
jgi:hypothetical protein